MDCGFYVRNIIELGQKIIHLLDGVECYMDQGFYELEFKL